MSETQSNRAGVDRAAILLLALGEQDAAQVLKHLNSNDMQRVGAAMAQLSGVSREEVSAVLASFATSVEQQTSLGVGTDEYLRKVLVGALGEDKAGGVIERILRGRSRAAAWKPSNGWSRAPSPRCCVRNIRRSLPSCFPI